MKKFFLSTLSFVLCSFAFAAEKVVWEGNEPISWNTEVYAGTQFETPEGTFSGLLKDDTIRVSVEAKIDEPQYVMTYKAGSGWEWTDLEDVTVLDGLMSYIVASDEIATEIAERGLVFRGQGYNMTQIVIASKDEEPEPQPEQVILIEGDTTVLWEDAEGVEMSWNEICEQDTALGHQLAAKDKIIVTVSAKSATTEWPKVILRDAASEEITNELLNEVSSFPYDVVFTLTAEEAAAVQEGFRISGDGVTITQVAAYKYKEGDEPIEPAEEYEDTDVWKGDKAISWNTDVYAGEQFDTYAAQQDMFAGLSKDDSIKVYFAEAIEGAQFAAAYKTGNDWAWADLTITEKQDFYAYKVATEEMAQLIADRGIVLRGQGYHAIRIVIGKPKKSTGVEIVQHSDISVQKVLRNGQVLILRNGVIYTVNGQIIR